MVNAMSEADARQALRAVGSPACDATFYSAERRPGGWLFSWKLQQGPPRMGTRAWIVADNGRVRMLGLAEPAAEGIAAALREQ